MLTRTLRRRAAQGLLGLMLFAQAALAVAACDWLRVAPAQAITAKAAEPSCHVEPARNVNLCLAHCLGADQSADTPQITVPEWSQPVSLMVVVFDVVPSRQAVLRHTLPRPGAPPPRILFQTFLI